MQAASTAPTESERPKFPLPLRARALETIQVNVGAECNLACRHCHVESSPSRRERMSWDDMRVVLEVASRLGVRELDVTGGAPELHPDLPRFLVEASRRSLGLRLRTNLTVLRRPELDGLPRLLRSHGVRLTASLPCYLESNVRRQRGSGVFEESIAVLRRLNDLGYAREPGLDLDLVYNPLGASLPGNQGDLERSYRVRLRDEFGVEFTRLLALANMPIGRFAQDLQAQGVLGAYFERLQQSFNPHTLDGLMCRSQIHVGWDGGLYDCDFNFVLGLPLAGPGPAHVRDLLDGLPPERVIATGSHCLGCTAGQGSSCSGALA